MLNMYRQIYISHKMSKEGVELMSCLCVVIAYVCLAVTPECREVHITRATSVADSAEMLGNVCMYVYIYIYIYVHI